MAVQIAEIQQLELSLFEEFKRICHKYHLTYFAIGGTCIGAIRHKGFIPWDDDIDIAMPYQDYMNFRLAAVKELPDYYSLFLPEERRNWCFNFMKLQDDRTSFIEANDVKFKDCYKGIYIDIMPIYGMPKGKMKQHIFSVICDMLIFLNNVQRKSFKVMDSKLRKVIWILNIPVRKCKSYDYYINLINRIFGKYQINNSNKIIFGWRKRPSRLHKKYTYQNVFYYKDFEKMVEYPFEDTSIAIPRGYDHYLKMDFGDYMKLPPKEQRYPKHDTELIDLNRSYKFY